MARRVFQNDMLHVMSPGSKPMVAKTDLPRVQAYNTAYALDIGTWEWRALRNSLSLSPNPTYLEEKTSLISRHVCKPQKMYSKFASCCLWSPFFGTVRLPRGNHFHETVVCKRHVNVLSAKGSDQCPSARYFVASFEHLGALYAWGGRSSQWLTCRFCFEWA